MTVLCDLCQRPDPTGGHACASCAERDRYRQLVGELQAALVHVADRLHEIERYARRQADAEPKP